MGTKMLTQPAPTKRKFLSLTQHKLLRVFIASPGDLIDERFKFRQAIEEVNRIKAKPMGVHLEPLGWEDTLPGKGRPQSIINKEIEACDLFVLLLWKRWGTASGVYSSGTEEEFELARNLNEKSGGHPEMWLYFKKVADEMLADPGEQLKRVLAFRKKIEVERSFLYRIFNTSETWEREFRLHLSLWLDNLPPFTRPPDKVELPPEIEKRLLQLENKVQQTVKIKDTTQTKLAQLAARLGKRALEAAREGRFTEAETLFASSLEIQENPDTSYAYGLFLNEFKKSQLSKENQAKLEDSGIKVNRDEDYSIFNLILALLKNEGLRHFIDTITTKAVLILGRFTPERKAVLDAIKKELSRGDYFPILFDFQKPTSRDISETISMLAHLSRFIIADLTDARSMPQDLAQIVPNLPSVPVQPILKSGRQEYSMLEHFKRFPWVLSIYKYRDIDDLIKNLKEKVIFAAEAKLVEFRKKENTKASGGQ